MKARLGFLCLLFFLGGCSATRYGTADRHLQRREYDQAIRAYLRLLDPHVKGGRRLIYYDRVAVTGIGTVYWYMKKYDTAARILRMVVDKDPDYGQARFYLGLALESLGRDDDAIDVYRDFVYVNVTDHYRKAIVGRLDWVVRRKILREIQMALTHEESLDVQEYPDLSLAVLYFMNLSDDPQWQPLQKGLAEMMITDLAQVEELKVIERIRVNQLMKELQLSRTGLIDEEMAPRVGKLLGARNLVKGSYMILPDRKLTLDAGIYNIEDIFTPELANLDGTLTRLFRMEKELVLRILDHFEIQLTAQERERILEIPTENMLAFLNYCRGLEALDEDDYSAAAEYFRQAVKMDMHFQMAHDRLMSEEMWDATHTRNAIRVSNDVASMISRMPIGSPEAAALSPDLVTTYTRLSRMGTYQNAGLLPGNDSRKAFQEAQIRGAPVVPLRLVEPPAPPGNE